MEHLVFRCAGRIAARNALQSNNFTAAIVCVRFSESCGFECIERAARIRQEMPHVVHTGSLECAGERQLDCARGRVGGVFIEPVHRLQTFSDILDRVGGIK